jgi:imidazolonepropionase-like amidohydrolase
VGRKLVGHRVRHRGRGGARSPTSFRITAPGAVRALASLASLVSLIAVLSPRSGAAQQGPVSAEPPYLALTHATVIDGTGAAPLPDRTILLRGDRIAAVFESGTRPLPDSARVEDLTGNFVIPGLIDAHVHLSGGPRSAADHAEQLGWMVRGGVTGVRDMAGDARILAYLARAAELDEIDAPDVHYSALVAGPTFFAQDARVAGAAQGRMVGAAPWMRAVTAATDARLVVAEARGAGAAALKLYANVSAGLLEGLVVEAHRQGLLAWAHAAVFPARPSEVVAAGADVLSHTAYLVWEAADRVPQDYGVRAMGDFRGTPPDEPRILAVLDSMKARGAILDATLWVFERNERENPDGVGAGIAAWGAAVTRLAHERGVLVDAGTDGMGSAADTVPNVHREMASLVAEAGFTPIEAIVAATRVGAMAAGAAATHGTVTPGKMADLVVLSADPTRDISNTRRIVRVYKHGRAIPRPPATGAPEDSARAPGARPR